MKEFALKHPWMTFFIADAAIYNVCVLINNCLKLFGGKKEGTADESSGNPA